MEGIQSLQPVQSLMCPAPGVVITVFASVSACKHLKDLDDRISEGYNRAAHPVYDYTDIFQGVSRAFRLQFQPVALTSGAGKGSERVDGLEGRR